MWSAVSKYQNGTPKVARKAFNMGEVWNQYVAMVTELSSLYCGAHLVESCCKESNISDTNWLRYLFSSYLNKIWSSVWPQHLVNLHILKTWVWPGNMSILSAFLEKMNCFPNISYITCCDWNFPSPGYYFIASSFLFLPHGMT